MHHQVEQLHPTGNSALLPRQRPACVRRARRGALQTVHLRFSSQAAANPANRDPSRTGPARDGPLGQGRYTASWASRPGAWPPDGPQRQLPTFPPDGGTGAGAAANNDGSRSRFPLENTRRGSSSSRSSSSIPGRSVVTDDVGGTVRRSGTTSSSSSSSRSSAGSAIRSGIGSSPTYSSSSSSSSSSSFFPSVSTPPASASASASPPRPAPRELSYSQRVAQLRKPALTAPDKLGLEPEERARIYRLLRTPRRRGTPPGGSDRSSSGTLRTSGGLPGSAAQPGSPTVAPGKGPGPRPGPGSPFPLPLRVFCYGIDDVRLYRALEAGDAVGLVVVARNVVGCDAVWAVRTKRTGRMLSLVEVSNAARNAGKPFVELGAVSPVRVMEALERLTGWPVPERLKFRPPPPVSYLPPLEADTCDSVEALGLLSGGLPLSHYLVARAGPHLPPPLLRELDCTDLYGSREALRPVNPQEREAARAGRVSRPHMEGSREARQVLRAKQLRARREAEGAVPW